MTASIDAAATPAAPSSPPSFGPARELTCRACGATFPLGDSYACMECFGPLEISYDFGTVTHADIETGPQSMWRYAPLLPVPSDIAHSQEPQPRHDQAGQGRQPGSGTGHEDALGQGRQRQSRRTRSRTASSRSHSRQRKSSGSPRSAVRPPATSPVPSPQRQLGRVFAPASSRRATSRPASSSPPPSTAALSLPSTATTTRSTGSARRSPATSAGASSTSTCARTTPRARRPLATRSPSSSAGACRVRWSRPSRRDR